MTKIKLLIIGLIIITTLTLLLSACRNPTLPQNTEQSKKLFTSDGIFETIEINQFTTPQGTQQVSIVLDTTTNVMYSYIVTEQGGISFNPILDAVGKPSLYKTTQP
jgi:hypothetical protein